MVRLHQCDNVSLEVAPLRPSEARPLSSCWLAPSARAFHSTHRHTWRRLYTNSPPHAPDTPAVAVASRLSHWSQKRSPPKSKAYSPQSKPQRVPSSLRGPSAPHCPSATPHKGSSLHRWQTRATRRSCPSTQSFSPDRSTDGSTGLTPHSRGPLSPAHQATS